MVSRGGIFFYLCLPGEYRALAYSVPRNDPAVWAGYAGWAKSDFFLPGDRRPAFTAPWRIPTTF